MATVSILLLLSGCIGAQTPEDEAVAQSVVPEATPPTTGATAEAPPAAPVDVDVPAWRVGDAWTVENFGFSSTSCTYAVTADASAYTLSPTCEDNAYADAMFDVSYLGEIRKSDLAGAQRGTPVQFFAFPLTDGKTWTTQWDDITVTLTAKFTPALVAPGLGSGPGYTIVGTTPDGDEYVKYDYSPALKWWTGITFEGGNYGLKVTRFQENWTGTYKTALANEVYSHAPPTAGVFVPGTFTVAEGQTVLLVMFQGGAQMGYGYSIRLVDPAGNVAWEAQDVGQATQTFSFATLSATPGDWRVVAAGSYNPDGGGFELQAFEVLVTDVALAAAA